MSDQPQKASSESRLAAIMFTDIVGYTTMMQKNEENALDAINRHRSILEEYTRKYNGSVMQYYGDGSLSIFSSGIEAVECAVEVQTKLTQDPQVPLRIGIHLGDVKIQGESLFGDGVNLASRIESLGTAGSILISESIYFLIRNNADLKTVYLGNFTLKNVDHRVSIYALSNEFLSVPKKQELHGRQQSFSRRSKWWLSSALFIILVLSIYGLFVHKQGGTEQDDKSIAILPFDNLSDDEQQQYFIDGITDDIINHLVKVSALKVKSKTTTEQYKNPEKTMPVIGRELGVSYILEGSVRRSNNAVRIVAQLIDVKNDVHLWTETYDREITEIFQIQSEIALEIAQVMEARLSSDERRHIWGGPNRRGQSADITAYDYVLRAREIWKNWNDENDLGNAILLLDQAINLDSLLARAYVLKANILHYGMRRFGVPTTIWIDEAQSLADLACSLDSTLAEAFLLRGNILRLQDGKVEMARASFKKAYDLAPGHPDILQSFGNYFLSQDDFERGATMIIQSIERGYSMKDPEYHLRWGDIYHRMDNYKRAEGSFQQAINLAPGWTSPYYSLGQLYRYWGKYDQAREILSHVLEISPLDQNAIDLLGWINLMDEDLDEAKRLVHVYGDRTTISRHVAVCTLPTPSGLCVLSPGSFSNSGFADE